MAEEQEINLDLGPNEKIGDYLRRVREARGLDIEHLAKSIRLGKNVLQAIEDNRWNEFPAEAYLRSYISSICEKLSVDKAVVLKKFSLDSNSHFSVEQNIIGEKKDEAASGNVAKILIVVILLAVAVLFFLNKFLNSEPDVYYDEEPEQEQPEPTIESILEDSVKPDTIETAPASPQPAKTAQAPQVPQEPQAPKTPPTPQITRMQDTLRFECNPVPDKSCGAIRMEGKKTDWFTKTKEVYIEHNDTTQITIYNPYQTKLFINNTPRKYNVNASRNNTFLFHKGEILSSFYKDLR